ncbi:MAG: hypothetical protein EHM41_09850 [Chloroflexi bacterium]|nr:MAG: hypothetical protein EHM41_09850 [Chloroflexota bacterium]
MFEDIEFMKATADQLNIGLVVTNRDDRIIIFNRLAGQMLEIDPMERIGSTIYSCHPKESEPIIRKMIGDIRSGVLDHFEGWLNFRGRLLYEYICPIRDRSGNFLGLTEELHDRAELSNYLKADGKWAEPHISGIGHRSPRPPEF